MIAKHAHTQNHHPINFPVSAAQKDPLLLKFKSATTLIIRSALSSGVSVLAVSLSSGTPLALRKDLSICVFTCSQASVLNQAALATGAKRQDVVSSVHWLT